MDSVKHDLMRKWGDDMKAAGLGPTEVVRLAGEFLSVIVMSVTESERDAHTLLNTVDEASHEYINANWVGQMQAREEAKRRLAQQN